MPIRIIWDYVILAALRDGEAHHLSEIYDFIDKELRDGSINPLVFNIDPISGAPPKYKHRVRSTTNSLKKRGMVEHVGRGRTGKYCITDAGRLRSEEIEP